MGRWSAARTLEIVDAGRYARPGGAEVEIGADISAARGNTRLYRPRELAALSLARTAGSARTRVEVTGEDTATAGRRLLAEGAAEVAVLNFASGRNVGGGFLGNARAQEEDLCRASALYRCLEAQPDYYTANRAHPDALYTDHIIWSPRVPFFLDRDARLVEPCALSVITAPAPNTRAVLAQKPDAGPAIREAFFRRAALVLAVARDQGQDSLVLGAWGCGAFGGDPQVSAAAFAAALSGPFAGAFARVVFAVLVARPSDEANGAAFRRELGSMIG